MKSSVTFYNLAIDTLTRLAEEVEADFADFSALANEADDVAAIQLEGSTPCLCPGGSAFVLNGNNT